MKLITKCESDSGCTNSTDLAIGRYETYCDLYIYGGCQTSIEIAERFSDGKVLYMLPHAQYNRTEYYFFADLIIVLDDLVKEKS
jgi:hypothetical protein